MKNIILTPRQLEKVVESYKNINEGSSQDYETVKRQLYTISTLSKAMWDKMEETPNDKVDDWMVSKINEIEQGVSSVVKSFMYNEFNDDETGMGKLNFTDIIIGK